MNQIKLKETDRHWTCGRAPGLKLKRSSFARGLELKGTDCTFACVCLTRVPVFAHVKRRHAGSQACYLAFAPLVSSQVGDAVWVLWAEPVSANGRMRRHFIFRNREYCLSLEKLLLTLCVFCHSKSPCQTVLSAGQRSLGYYWDSWGPRTGP